MSVASAIVGLAMFAAQETEPVRDWAVRLADCIITYESGWDHLAVNRRSGASGWGQFLPSTWRTTPQGRAGLSVFDPYANHAAVVWMVRVGRAREFDVLWRCTR